MKKAILPVLLFFIIVLCSYAENLKAGIQSDNFVDYFETVNLTPAQREQILRIRNEENFVLKPLTLDIESKERGLEFLGTLQCRTFDFECKKKLRADIEQREAERKEILRQISQKKNYYGIRYKNVLTREQYIKIQKLIEETAHKDKVLMERAERAKKQEKIDKLKFWEKFKK